MSVPKLVKQSDGSTATVTLNRVRYATTGALDQGTDLVVADLTITNTGTRRFPYSEDQVAFAYPDSDNPWTHQNDDHIYGPDPSEDYRPFLPPNPLRAGDLKPGTSARGLVILEVSPQSPYLLYFGDNTDGSDLAEWRLTSR